MATNRMLVILKKSAIMAGDLVAPTLTATAGILADYGKNITRTVTDSTLKDSIKSQFALGASSVNFLVEFGCGAESVKLLIEAWPILSQTEKRSFALLLTASALLYAYPLMTFGSEKQIVINTALTTLSVVAAKSVSIFAAVKKEEEQQRRLGYITVL